ncbi:YtxH domain-containing protein [Apilactobacillus kunkeei]|uniref:YtxH domain-containing protein n=1 Tax=Apilactobacillus kunkeei TaxID=148814 RepID=UPI004033B016
MKKTGLFLLGLTTGAAAAVYLAYRKMDDEKTKEFVNSTVKTANDLKDRALDYAFYALDSVDDVKEQLQYKTSDAKSKIKDAAGKVNDNVVNKAQYYYDEGSTQFHKAADNLRNQVRKNDDDSQDIVIDPDAVKKEDNLSK